MQEESKTLLEEAPHASHYKGKGMEPIEYIEANHLPFHEASIVKYITRWRDKDGIKDLEKVVWYARRLIEQEQKSLDAQKKNAETPRQNPPPTTVAAKSTF